MNIIQIPKTTPMNTNNSKPVLQDPKPPSLSTTPHPVNEDEKEPPMNNLTDEPVEHADPVNELLKQAAATAYCRPALKALGYTLPADDAILTAALNKAAEERNEKVFTNLYVATLYAGRRIGVEVLELGAALLHPGISLETALRLNGDAAKSLAVAIRSGRMNDERNIDALLAGWLHYKYRGVSAPSEFLALTRKVSRKEQRVRMTKFAQRSLAIAKTLSGDLAMANTLSPKVRNFLNPERMADYISESVTDPTWDNSIPESPVAEIMPSGRMRVKRSTPKTARNAPCPCGSGKKFKHCCDGYASVGHQYEIHGVTFTDATSHAELVLTEERIKTMRYPELYAVNPKLLPHDLAEKVALNLARFHEFPRAIQVLQEIGRESVSEDTLNNIAFEFFEAKDDEALRWIIHWAPGTVEVSFEMKVLLAAPEERLQLLNEKAFAALDAEQSGDTSSAQAHFGELGTAALLTNPALGIVVAHGVLPVCGPANETLQIQGIEDARDILGLGDNEPGRVIVNAIRHAREIENLRTEMSTKVANRDAEIRRLHTEILSLQETLKEREAIEMAKVTRKGNATAPAASEAAEIRELMDKNRRLKCNIKAEHEEHKHTKQELEAARDQLRRANEILENHEHEEAADYEQEDDDIAPTDVVPGWQPLRIPEYGADFLESVRLSPLTAYTLAGRLAAGDPSSWNKVCAIKSRPGTLRAKAGDFRLFFEIAPGGDSLIFVDFILRRDFDTRLKNGR